MNTQERFFLEPGYMYTSHEEILVHTVLGSSVSVCVWDRQSGYGGMNHFIYPRKGANPSTTKYGDVAIRYLIQLMCDSGSRKSDLLVHLLGGAENPELDSRVGADNVELAERLLKKHNIEIATRDVGGSIGRKIVFNLGTGEVITYKCLRLRESDWY